MPHLFVIAGHGAGDPGAAGSGFNEAERVRALAKKLKELGGDSVTLGDVNRDYYADNGISTLDIPKDWQILELHMDSASATAKGGHVIINAGVTASKYDNALANFITSYFPGRANKIVQRNDLANPARAAAKGYPYRLLETCFISNPDDIKKFNANIDAVAKGILEAFDITPGKASTTTTTKGKVKEVKPITNTGGKVYRAYNTNSGEHFYAFEKEINTLKSPWKKEGVAFTAPKGGTVAIYRMYNPNTGFHFFTPSYDEAASLEKAGWTFEGVPFFGKESGTPVYRVYNKNNGDHFYTLDKAERDSLIKAGWKDEKIGFYV